MKMKIDNEQMNFSIRRMIPFKRLLIGGIVVGGVGVTAHSSFKSIPAGHIGYKNLFGKVDNKQYEPGYTFTNPFSKMIKLDLRKRIAQTESQISSNEGLEINAKVDIIYRLDKVASKDVYLTAGLQYQDVLLLPQAKAIIRDIVSGYDAKALYHEKTRIEIKNKIFDELRKISDNGIIVEEILINKIVLPASLVRSIENKLQAEQEMQKMDFILEREKKESERKKIEANGIKEFQTIVSEGISKELLQWKGITATEELTKSPNSKIVIIGNSSNGLPLIFNSDK
jgi:regulator of protease activity HflC (stomatin/prohibitin superfamily)